MTIFNGCEVEIYIFVTRVTVRHHEAYVENYVTKVTVQHREACDVLHTLSDK